MADYPDLPQIVIRTQDIVQDDRQVVVTEGGVVFGRSFYHVNDFDFMVHHDLTPDQWATLIAHYRAHRALAFDFEYKEDAVTYLCRWARIPTYRGTTECDSLDVISLLKEVTS